MPGAITRTPQSPLTGTLLGPENGDQCDKPSVTATDTGFQRLANETLYLGQQLSPTQNRLWIDGAMAGRLEVYCYGGTNVITVGPIDEIALYTGGSPSIAVFQTNDVTTIDPGALAASTKYYVYAWYNAGSLALEVSTTAPDGASKRWKTSDVSRRYLASFVSDSANNVRPFYKVGGRYAYLRAAGPDTLVVLAAGASATFADVDLSALVPAHARLVHLSAQLSALATLAVGTTGQAFVRTKGQTGDDSARCHALNVFQAVASQAPATGFVPITLSANASGLVQYRLTAATDTRLALVLDGYEDSV